MTRQLDCFDRCSDGGMRRMGTRLIAIDLDDTLLDRELTIPEEAREAIQAAVRRGIVVTLATGRMYESALPFALSLGLDVPLITYNGALIKTSISREVYRHICIPKGLAEEVIRYCQGHGLHVNLYFNDKLYVREASPEALDYQATRGVSLNVVGDLEEFLNRGFLNGDPTKLLVVADEHILGEHESVLHEMFRGKLSIVRSYPTYLEVVSRGVSKGEALRTLAGRFGIEREEVLAIGDNHNDVDMIEYAGVGVAVGNATAAVISGADYVTAGSCGRGVAEAIRKFAL